MTHIYKDERLVGEPCTVHDDFLADMDVFCSLLEKYNLKANINSSLRASTLVPGAIVPPAQMSNHLVGCAVDCNLIDSTGKLWNHIDMQTPTGDVSSFIQAVQNSGLRWGGTFHPIDSVHFDNGINIHNPERWHEIYNELHP